MITEPVTDAPQAPEPEPVSEPEPVKSPVVDLNNTNRNLTPDELAAFFRRLSEQAAISAAASHELAARNCEGTEQMRIS